LGEKLQATAYIQLISLDLGAARAVATFFQERRSPSHGRIWDGLGAWGSIDRPDGCPGICNAPPFKPKIRHKHKCGQWRASSWRQSSSLQTDVSREPSWELLCSGTNSQTDLAETCVDIPRAVPHHHDGRRPSCRMPEWLKRLHVSSMVPRNPPGRRSHDGRATTSGLQPSGAPQKRGETSEGQDFGGEERDACLGASSGTDLEPGRQMSRPHRSGGGNTLTKSDEASGVRGDGMLGRQRPAIVVHGSGSGGGGEKGFCGPAALALEATGAGRTQTASSCVSLAHRPKERGKPPCRALRWFSARHVLAQHCHCIEQSNGRYRVVRPAGRGRDKASSYIDPLCAREFRGAQTLGSAQGPALPAGSRRR